MAYIGKVPSAVPITSADLADSIVTSAKIVDGTIALADLSATGTASASTFLRGDNSWQEAGGGAFETLSTTTITSSTSKINLSAIFSSTYNVYKILLHNIIPSGNEDIFMRFLTTGTTEDTTTNYNQFMNCAVHQYSTNAYQNPTDVRKDQTAFLLTTWGAVTSSSTYNGFNTEITLFNPNKTNMKHIKVDNLYIYQNTDYIVGDYNSMYHRGTSAFTGVSIYPSTTTIASGTITVIGVK